MNSTVRCVFPPQTQARPQSSALHAHKRASRVSVRAMVGCVAVVLVDDRHQRNIEVVQVQQAVDLAHDWHPQQDTVSLAGHPLTLRPQNLPQCAQGIC